jgi:hypothetical protein
LGRRSCISAGKLSSHGFGAGHFRSERALDQARTSRFEKSSTTSSAIHGPGMDTAHVDHQKDVIGLVFSQRLGRQATQKK